MRGPGPFLGTVRPVSMRRSSRLFAASVVLAGVLAACAPTEQPAAAPSPTTVDAAAVNAALATVADTRAVAAGHVDAELRAAVRVEPLAQSLRSPSSIDESLEDVPGVAVLLQQVDTAAGDAVLDDLDAALDGAATAISQTAAMADPGSWQVEFLTAQGEVVTALQGWAAASRDVHALAVEHWPMWQDVLEEAAVLDENRWRYRSPEEAAATWEIEVADVVEPLAAAHATVTAAAEGRDAAAAEVASADRAAAEVFDRRPTEQATP